jgi:hypothetical protein
LNIMPDSSRFGLALLRQTYAYARDAGADLWDFALEIDRLFKSGLTIIDLRWLVAKRFVEHGQESFVCGSPHRSFRPSDGFCFENSTCVVLTPSGAAYVDRVLREPFVLPRSTLLSETASVCGGEAASLEEGFPEAHDQNGAAYVGAKPFWNSSRRELSMDGLVVKRFRVPAKNQEVILCAFEEERWPDQIDDPLPVGDDIDPRTRLHDAINRLNHRQTNHMLQFSGNGNGTGIIWKARLTVVSHRPTSRPLRTSNAAASIQTAPPPSDRVGSSA